jgi:hypothetical protein
MNVWILLRSEPKDVSKYHWPPGNEDPGSMGNLWNLWKSITLPDELGTQPFPRGYSAHLAVMCADVIICDDRKLETNLLLDVMYSCAK